MIPRKGLQAEIHVIIVQGDVVVVVDGPDIVVQIQFPFNVAPVNV